MRPPSSIAASIPDTVAPSPTFTGVASPVDEDAVVEGLGDEAFDGGVEVDDERAGTPDGEDVVAFGVCLSAGRTRAAFDLVLAHFDADEWRFRDGAGHRAGDLRRRRESRSLAKASSASCASARTSAAEARRTAPTAPIQAGAMVALPPPPRANGHGRDAAVPRARRVMRHDRDPRAHKRCMWLRSRRARGAEAQRDGEGGSPWAH